MSKIILELQLAIRNTQKEILIARRLKQVDHISELEVQMDDLVGILDDEIYQAEIAMS